jgi:Flp pilus assembly protein TadB
MGSKLASEKVVISAPTSFSGSAARIWKMTDSDNAWIKWLLLVPIALGLIFMAWSFVAIWYVVIFGLFGIFVIPFRLLTRSGRNRKRNALQHRELLAAVRDNHKRQITDDELITTILPTINNDGS